MNEAMRRARAQYEAQPTPEALEFAVASALREGERRRSRRRAEEDEVRSTL